MERGSKVEGRKVQAQQWLNACESSPRIPEKSRLGGLGPPPIPSLHLVDTLAALDLVYAKDSLGSNAIMIINLGFESNLASSLLRASP